MLTFSTDIVGKSLRNFYVPYNNSMRVLLIEDELALGRLISQGLELAGYQVTVCRNGVEGFERACEGGWTVILLDVMLPGMDGWGVCRRLRDRRNTTPILMLTALDEVDERVKGLNLGADDYLVKPFAFEELQARVAALIRRERQQRRRHIKVADIEIDTEAQEATRAGQALSLTPREYELLATLASREGHVVSREAILAAWGDPDSASNTVDVHVAALRRKIDGGRPEEEKLIHTVHRRGYILRESTP